MSDSALPWAAGLFEGEGCFSIQRSGLGPRASISMTDEDVIQRFSEVMVIGSTRLGSVRIQPRKNGLKTSYVWSANAFAHVQQVVAMFWPWLGERRRQRAAEVLHLASQHRNRGRAGWNTCRRGHPLIPENIYIPPNRPNARRCRLCGGYSVPAHLKRQFEVAA